MGAVLIGGKICFMIACIRDGFQRGRANETIAIPIVITMRLAICTSESAAKSRMAAAIVVAPTPLRTCSEKSTEISKIER